MSTLLLDALIHFVPFKSRVGIISIHFDRHKDFTCFYTLAWSTRMRKGTLIIDPQNHVGIFFFVTLHPSTFDRNAKILIHFNRLNWRGLLLEKRRLHF